MEAEKSLRISEEDNIGVFEDDALVYIMRRRYSVEFMQLFSMGYQNYSQGEWQVARRMLSIVHSVLGSEDGPSNALLKFMEVPHRFDAPKYWAGVRELGA